jgi:hypothetical protein
MQSKLLFVNYSSDASAICVNETVSVYEYIAGTNIVIPGPHMFEIPIFSYKRFMRLYN